MFTYESNELTLEVLVSVGYNVLVVSRNSVAIEHVIYIVEYCNDLLLIAVLLAT